MGNKIKIKDFLCRKKEAVRIDPNNEYSLTTVRLHHKGVILRERKKGNLIKSKMFKISEGQFILSGIDARNGAFGIVPKELDGALITNDFWTFEINEKIVKRDFFYWFTNTPLFLEVCHKSSKGETQRIRLQKELFINFEFHFPPIEKQEEFLKQLNLIDASLAFINREQNNQTSYITLLRQSILQDAIEGKLTVEWRKKNPVKKGDPETDAAALLEKIKKEKQKLIAEGNLKKGKLKGSTKSYRSDLSIPVQWSWCKADDIFFVTKLAGFEYTKHISLMEEGDIPVIRAQNVRPLNIIKSNLLFICKEVSFQLDRCALTKECLLVTFIGAGIGDVATFKEKERWHLAPNVAKMEPFVNCEKFTNSRYFNYYLLSASGKKEIFKHIKATAQPSLSMETIRDIDFPLPPLGEQRAILERVDELLQIVDELEKEAAARQTLSEDLMHAVLKEAFEGGVK